MDKSITRIPCFCGLTVVSLVLSLPASASCAEEKKPTRKEPAAGKGSYGGYGRNATGGAGHPTVEVDTFDELSRALKKGNAIILLKADISVPRHATKESIETTASNITLDGQGHTIRGDDLPEGGTKEGRGTGHLLKFTGGKNFILKNFRIRNANSGGNICFYKGARDIVIDHVSSTGCTNKAIAISNGSHDATITHCFLAGNTRSIFIKYEGTTRITIDHCIIMKFLMRGPLINEVKEFDIRNNYIQEWVQFGTGIEGDTSNGNIMGNIYVQPKDTSLVGKPNKAIMYRDIRPVGKVFVKDNVFKDCSTLVKSTTDRPLDTPAIVPAYTTDLVKLEKQLLSNSEGAGCMPRDAADRAYIAARKWDVKVGTAFRVPESLPGKSEQPANKKK